MHRVVRRALSGEVLIGTWITIGTPEVTEALANLPIDFVVIDMEHAPLDFYTVELLLMGLKGSSVAGIVRAPWNDPVAIKRILDLGPDGLLVPWISTKEEALAVERAVLYPPAGIRGVGPRRAVAYGIIPRTEYYRSYLENLIVMVQIETKEGLSNLDDILAVKTINGVLVGPSDLSASLGVFGEFDSPIFLEAIRTVADKARGKKPLVAMYAPSVKEAVKAVKLGYNVVALSSDIAVMIEGYKRMIDEVMKEVRR